MLVDVEYIANGNARVKYRIWTGTVIAVLQSIDPHTFLPKTCAKVRFDDGFVTAVDWHLLEKYDG